GGRYGSCSTVVAPARTLPSVSSVHAPVHPDLEIIAGPRASYTMRSPDAARMAVGEHPEDRPSEITLDAALVASLYVDHGHELRRFVLGVVRAPELAADVVQATFVKALERGHEARAESLKGWLFRVAYHEALAARRRQATRDQALRRLAPLYQHTSDRPEEGL